MYLFIMQQQYDKAKNHVLLAQTTACPDCTQVKFCLNFYPILNLLFFLSY